MAKTPMQTMAILPDNLGTRFSTFSLGYDRVSTIREEHSLLHEIVADCCGLPPVALMLDDVKALRQKRRERAALLQTDRTNALATARELVDRAMRLRADDPHRKVIAADAALWVLALGL